MNKKWLIAVPFALALAGCNAQGETTAQVPAAEVAAAAPKGSTPSSAVAQKAPAKKVLIAKSGKSAPGKPDPKYKVVDEADPRMPPELIAALKKVKVSPPPQKMTIPKKARVRLTTSKGSITVELNETAAPLHVKSFLYLTKLGFFDNTVLHRYEPGFVIQGGDPLSKNPKLEDFFGTGGPGYQIPREKNSLKHTKLVLAAARSQDPDSAGSQFYITLAEAAFLDEGDGYTVFGKVVTGGDNVLKLRAGDKLTKAALIAPPKKPA